MSRTAEEVGYQADVQGNMIEQHERRLRELETRYSPAAQEQDHAWARKVDEKLEELDRCTDVFDGRISRVENDWFRDANSDQEAERRADWKRTYNAALPQCMDHPLEETHRLASAIADRAHGPLEAKSPEIPWGDKFTEEYVAHVDALVKAARAMLNHTSMSEEIPRDFDDALEAALKPFEVTT